MATQTDVQQLIQGLTPSGVNNGNPNTAYNFAPPTQDAQGNWFGGGVGPAASITALNLTPHTPWTPPENTGVPGGNLLDLLPSIPEGGIPTNPGWSPTPMPNPSTGGGGGTTTGGGKGPQGQGWNDGPATGIGGGNAGGATGNPPRYDGLGPGSNPPGTISGVDVRAWANQFNSSGQAGTIARNSGLPVNDQGRLDLSSISSNDRSSIWSSLGKFAGNLLDVFLPGNAYDPTTGWDLSNIATGYLNTFIPFAGPIAALFDVNVLDVAIEMLSEVLPDGKLKDALAKHVADQAAQAEAEKAREEARKNKGRGGGGFEGINYGSFDQTGRTTDGLGLGQNFLDSRTPSIGVGGGPAGQEWGFFNGTGQPQGPSQSAIDAIGNWLSSPNPDAVGFWPGGGGGGGGGAGGPGSGGGGGGGFGGGGGGSGNGGARQAFRDRYYSNAQ